MTPYRSGPLETASLYLTMIGGVCLLGIVALVMVGVVMRYVFSTPILGINEIVQMTAVALVMASLPYTTVRENHVAIDVFENWLGRWGRLIGDLLSRSLAAFMLAILCRRAALRAFDAYEFTDTTNMLRMPIWPFYAILAAGSGLCVLVFLLQVANLLRKRASS